MVHSERMEGRMAENEDISETGADAEFLGWQRTSSGGDVPLFNVTAEGHPSFGSTLTEKGLKKLDLKVPDIPLRGGS